MYRSRFEHEKAPAGHTAKRRVQRARKRMAILVLSAVLLLAVGIGGTLAFLVDTTDPITNTFTSAQVSCHVTESFDGTTKTNVNVVNDSNIDAYIRVKLVTYRVNDAGQHIGGTATIPSFTRGTDWFEKDGYYYYSKPVAAGSSPANPLIGSTGIELEDVYTDADGGKQVIEVMAEAIQSVPASVVKEQWKVMVNDDGTLTQSSSGIVSGGSTAGGITGY